MQGQVQCVPASMCDNVIALFEDEIFPPIIKMSRDEYEKGLSEEEREQRRRRRQKKRYKVRHPYLIRRGR